MSELLEEYRALVAKIDETARVFEERSADALACKRGCDRCCVGGLELLPVEAAHIAAWLEEHEVDRGAREGMCAFLDDEGACAIYPARPLVCRTQGLALRTPEPIPGVRALPVVGAGFVTACELNFVERVPAPNEILDEERVQALLFVVDQRYRARAKLEDEGRVPLSALVA